MAFVNNQGVRIHYEVIGQGFPLVLHHGLIGSWVDWLDFGYVDALKNDFQLVLPDGRGHGQSDKPHDTAAYDLRLRTLDVVAVLDELGITQAHYFGYSMGGYIGLGMAKFARDRIKSFIFGGTHPYTEDMSGFRNVLSPEVFPTMIEPVYGSAATPQLRARLLANDLEALKACASDRPSIADDVLPLLKTARCQLFVGDLDPRLANVQKCAAQLPNASFFTVPGCDHIAALVRSEFVLPRVTAFLTTAAG